MKEEKSRMSKFLRGVSITLAAAFVLQMAPIYTSAEETKKDSEATNTQVSSEEKSSSSDNSKHVIISEDKEKRTEDSKEFILSNGTRLIAMYGTPVHYQEDNGEWQDFDNTVDSNFKGLSFADGINTEYNNKKSNKDIHLSNKAKNNKMVSVNSKGAPLSWGFEGIAKSRVEFKNNDAPKEGNDKFLALPNLTQEAWYHNVYSNVDMQYFITATGVKENIVLKSAEAQREFTVNYDIGDLTVNQVDDRTIELANDAGEMVYTLAAPVMTDANGMTSDNITLSVSKNEKNKLTVQMKVDNAWLDAEERSYPVTVDPFVFTKQTTSGIQNTTLVSNPVSRDKFPFGALYAGRESTAYGYCSSVVKMDNLPQLRPGDMVIDAQLNLLQMNYSGNANSKVQVNVSKVTSSWSQTSLQSGSIINQSGLQPNHDSTIEDYVIADQSTIYTNHPKDPFTHWDITRTVKGWFNKDSQNNDSQNNGLCIWPNDPNQYAYAKYTAADNYSSFDSTCYPWLQISYLNNNGIENCWTYHESAVGINGTASVNDYTGNLAITENILSTTGSRMPTNISLAYNSSNYNNQFPNSRLGIGFQFNFNQRVDNVSADLQKIGYKYRYTDADGTEHYFRQKEGSTTEWVDEEGLGLTLTVYNGIYIRDKQGNEWHFNMPELGGHIYHAKDSDGNTIRYVSDNSYKINSIVDGAGRTTNINYTTVTGEGQSYEHPTSIVDPDGRTTKLVYEDWNKQLLNRIVYPDGTYTLYWYDGSNRLAKIRSSENKRVEFTYTNDKITKVAEYSSNYSNGSDIGNTLSISYNKDNTTTFTDNKGRTNIYQFNNEGQTVSVRHDDGSITNTDFNEKSSDKDGQTTASPDSTKFDKMKAASNSQKYVRNYLLNPSGEKDNDGFYNSCWDDSGKTSQSYDGSVSFLGNRSMKLVHNQTGMRFSSFAQQVMTTSFSGGYATLSAYVKTQNVQVTNSNGGAGLYLIFYDSKGTVLTDSISKVRVTGTQDWQRISLTSVQVPSNTTEIRAYLGLHDATGTAWFDCAQLEKGNTMSDCNLLEDGDFYRTDRWSAGNFTGNDSYAGNGFVNIQGVANRNDSGNKYFYQYMNVNRANVCFNMLGIIQANSVKIKDGRCVALEMHLIYEDGTPEYQTKQFNYSTSDRQAISFVVKPKKSLIVSTVGFFFLYRYNANTCRIDNAMLTIDETGSTYDYDSKGNLASASDNAKRNQLMTFNDANELTESTNSNNESYAYTYDSTYKHRMLTAKSKQLNNGFTFGYDGAGNVTNTTMGSLTDSNTIDTAKPYMNSSTKYDASMNYVISKTNARGKTTTYNVNTVNGLTNFIKVPMTIQGVDGLNQATSYSYNQGPTGNYLLRKVSSTDNGTTMSAAYDYYTDTNRLKTITHNGFSYSFNYDVWGNPLNTLIGTRTLSTNSYFGNNGLLQKTTYGNGNYKSFTYDLYDRVSQINTEKGVLAQYTYNNEGQLARIADSASGTNSDYLYDLSGRLVQSNKTGSSSKQQQQYTYDNLNRVTSQTNWIDNYAFAFDYTYGKDNLLTKSAQGGVVFNYNYDNLNRVRNVTGNYNSTTLKEEYSYLNNSGSNATTSLVSNIRYYIGSTLAHQTNYSYDDGGNIKTIDEDGGNYSRHYYYDAFNQLVREDNANLYYTKTYDYDAGGNLTAVTRYAYTTDTLDDPLYTVSYGYGDNSWRDLMTSYDGQTITYDGIGNPLQYRNGMTMTWKNGRQLATLQQGSNTISYTYGEDGLRTQKTVNGAASTYLRDDSGRLICYTTPGHAMWFYYNPGSSTPDSIVYNGNRYIYFKNAQGDIYGIVDGNGNIVAGYDYDSWGKCAHVYDANYNVTTDPNFIGNVNPIRYRGYEYDTETGLYSLLTRYYDPVTGRFLNADGYISTGTGFLGYNMFAYCNNNPVNMCDSGGNRPLATCGRETSQDVAVSLAAMKQIQSRIIQENKRVASTTSSKSNSISINDFRNKDGSYSLYDNRRHNPDSVFHEQILSAKVSKPSFSLKKGSVGLGSASATLMTGGWEYEHFDLSLLDVGNATLSAKYQDGSLDVSAMASAWVPSATVKIWDISITASANVGSIGGELNVGSGHFKAGAAYGWGASLSVDW